MNVRIATGPDRKRRTLTAGRGRRRQAPTADPGSPTFPPRRGRRGSKILVAVSRGLRFQTELAIDSNKMTNKSMQTTGATHADQVTDAFLFGSVNERLGVNVSSLLARLTICHKMVLVFEPLV